MANVSSLGEYLKQEFLNGQGVVTQSPGEKYTNARGHKGYDVAVPAGTPINTSKLQYKGSQKDATGYGLRANYYDPKTNQSYFFSHLSKLEPKNGTMLAYTGGIPGVHGRSTGPHLDVEVNKGLADFGSSFMSGLQAISGAMGRAMPSQGFDLNAILARGANTAKSQGKRLVAYSNNPNKLQGVASKVKGSIVRL